jgi:hypothetical protein
MRHAGKAVRPHPGPAASAQCARSRRPRSGEQANACAARALNAAGSLRPGDAFGNDSGEPLLRERVSQASSFAAESNVISCQH